MEKSMEVPCEVKVKAAQSCLTHCDPMDCIVPGIFQPRILKWVAFPFSRGSSQTRDWTQVSHIAGGFFTSWATREALRILEWVAYPFSSWCSRPKNRTGVSCITGRFFTNWAMRKAKLKIEVSYDPAIPLLGIYHEEIMQCTPLFIAALFTIARNWKQPKCLSTDELFTLFNKMMSLQLQSFHYTLNHSHHLKQ